MNERVYNILRIALFVGLLIGGFYTLAYYLGVGVHQSVLVKEAAREAAVAACGPESYFCVGWQTLFPFLAYTIERTWIFSGYIMVSLFAFVVLAVVSYLQASEWKIRFTLRPVTLLALFVLSLWMLFTTVSFMSNGGNPYTRLYEPLPQVYVAADAEGIAVLQENFKNLQDGGCLTQIGTTDHDARVFEMSHFCMQKAFFTRVLPHVFMLGFLIFVILVLGRAILRLLRMPTAHPLTEFVFSIGMGSFGLIILLWAIALLSIYTQMVGWALLIIIPVAFFKDSLYWLRAFVRRQWTYEGFLSTGALILGWLLITYLALNFFNVVRPFPIGWDDLGKYINQPRLLVSYGHFIPQLASFQWEYLTSLGFLLFGYDSIFGATFAMMINWMAGLFAVIVVYAFARLYLGRQQGFLAAFIFYSLPLVGHFSFADMKVDNAVFMVGALAMLAMFLALFPLAHEEEEADEQGIEVPQKSRAEMIRWVILAGLLGGLAFALKPTAIMVLMASGAIMFGAVIHWSAFLGAVSLVLMLFIHDGHISLKDIGTRAYGDAAFFNVPIITGMFLLLGLGLLAYGAWKKRDGFLQAVLFAGIFIASFLVSIAPWSLFNNIAHGNVIPHLVFTAPNTITPIFIMDGEAPPSTDHEIRVLPEELQIDSTQCKGTAKTEELDRYWGYRSGWSHYLMLPWRSVMNLDSAGYYVTTVPALFLFVLLILLPFFWIKQGKWLRWLWVGTLFVILQWIFVANGILWYGIGMFLGLAVGLEALVFRAPDTFNKVLAAIMITLSLFIAFAMRVWQFETQTNLFEYPLGKVSAEAMRERTIPHYDDIREIIEQRIARDPEHPYVYRMGTFIPYFIPRNLEVIPVADHQLDMFNCMNQERDARLTLQRLVALGFNSMIFDTNTHTIERDPNGSLHQKVQRFLDFVNTPGLGIQIVVNDPDNGIAFILLPTEVPIQAVNAPIDEEQENNGVIE